MVRINRRSLLGQWAHWAQLAVVAAVLCPADVLAGSNDKLIVHEWGTFTSFSGSDGVKLEFRPLVENDLPRFVGTTLPSWNDMLSKRSIRAIQRMETPVTYFYTPVERDVSVKVNFPQGLLTEYFPPVIEHAPKQEAPSFFGIGDRRALPDIPLKDGMLDWFDFLEYQNAFARAR